ncbi:hypothetical protein SAMN05892883_0153 [Jatrophihabitans sp. GAS493]|uniref:hypothetical protein n=1 Tax=Jatrophihabitans sp. GAS493 TaxID=1907575 RepID=UPI000BB76CE9|nr:hypothetical protein [Jatrophihabitans sp. GAS493]SOD70455.1 hypothetical protein SAMN05892883_0153 [Jatrophihabitans sp. GAS493]
MRRLALLASTAATVAIATIALAQPASADTGDGRNQPFLGNVTGGARPDRITLGSDANGCTVTVEKGRANGTFAPPVVHEYTIPGLAAGGICPDMGVAVARKHSATDDIVVTWFDGPYPSTLNHSYALGGFHVLSAAGPTEWMPSVIGSQDFNGDGRGDLWESTDQGEGFQTFLRSGATFVAGPIHFANDHPGVPVNFGNLDGKRGTDIATSYAFSHGPQPGQSGSGALVAFGSSGAIVTLESDPTGETMYATALLDANHDHKTDVQVSGGDAPPRVYLNDGHGHFTLAFAAANGAAPRSVRGA